MSTLTKPFTFTGGQFAVAAQVNSDLDTLYGWVNGGNAIWADGSRAFTAIPTGPAADPSSLNQFARARYVMGDGTRNGLMNLMQWGVTSATTDSSGNASQGFLHAFSTVGAVFLQAYGQQQASPIFAQVTTTGFNYHVATLAGASVNNTLVHVYWMAIGS